MAGKIRFAPSPTGYLHEGHLLSALYVWAAAKKWNLHVHLRIEDHDRGRTRQAYIDGIREDLEWLGFEHDSESIQSKRTDVYQDILDKLTNHGLTYPCTCSRKQLDAENPKSATGEIIYQGKCRCLAERLKEKGERGSGEIRMYDTGGTNLPPHNLRYKVPDVPINWIDYRLGEFTENPAKQCGDFPIRDREGCWTYQFAVCVDDVDQDITHIVRGEDIRNSTARQIALSTSICEVLEKPYNRPLYLHHSLIVDASGKKLSKRELAHSIRQDKEAGISAETLLGRVISKAGLQKNDAPISLAEAIDKIAATL